MRTDMQSIPAREAVLAFLDALNIDNFDAARTWVSDSLLFLGVLGARHGADDYFRDMKKMKLKYAVQKVFEDGNDICIWYVITMGALEIPAAGWYRVEEGKIASIKVIFDPRPVLAQAKQ